MTFSLIFPHSTRPEKAAATLAEKSPAMILPLWQGWFCDQVANIKRICNLFQAHEVTIQSRVGGPEIALGSDVKRKVVK